MQLLWAKEEGVSCGSALERDSAECPGSAVDIILPTSLALVQQFENTKTGYLAFLELGALPDGP